MAADLSHLVGRTQGWEQMKASILRMAATLGLFTLIPLSLRPNDCTKCDCSHFPISDPECVKCCFNQKGNITDSSSTSLTLAPISGDKKRHARTFRIQKSTKIYGKLRQGVPASVYYHTVDGQDIATRVDGPGYYHGLLVPANLPDPPDTCAKLSERFKMLGLPQLPAAPADAIKVFLGDSEGYLTGQRIVALLIDGDESLVLQKTESGWTASAKVRGRDGQLEAQIVDNEFFINPRNSFRIDGVGTSSLRVFNPQGELILEVEFLNPHAIKILGTFFGPNAEELTIGQDMAHFSGLGKSFVFKGECFGVGDHGLIEVTPSSVKMF